MAAPLASGAAMDARFNALTAVVATLATAVSALPTHAQLAAAVAGAVGPAVAAAFAQHNVAAVTTAATRIVQDSAYARMRNNHDRRGDALLVVPRADGAPPASWPVAGFTRAALFSGPIADVDVILADYGMPNGAGAGTPLDRRNALSLHIGMPRA